MADHHRHRLLEDAASDRQPPSRSRHHPHAGAHARRHHRPRFRRNHGSPIREDQLMPTSLTLDTARRDDGKLVLTAAGEIDLSNIDAFDLALDTAATQAAAGGGRLTVDLSAIEYLDSAAINALFAR